MKYWCDNSAVRTHFLDGWSTLFPAWELAFAKIAEHHKPFIKDENLKARIDEFISQEIAHANAHRAHNSRIGAEELEKEQERGANIATKRLQDKRWLAAMVSIEYLATCCSRLYLDLYGNKEGREYKLFAWHCREELSHKSLAMDIWEARGFDKKVIKKIAFINQAYIYPYVIKYMFKQLKNDKAFSKPSTYLELLVVFGIVLKGIVIPSLKIFGDKFHPNNEDDSKYLRLAA
jgi:predicted metal-dependent hydrolase